METAEGKSPESMQPKRVAQSASGLIFQIAYDRLWSSKALKVWEIIFWLPFVIRLGFGLHGYSYFLANQIMVGVCLVVIPLLSLILIAAWINRVHVSFGRNDSVIQTVPLHPIQILGPRMLAVTVTWLQVFLPLALFLYMDILETTDWYFQMKYGVWEIPISLLVLAGWVGFWISWGIAVGSRVVVGGGNFWLLYYAPLALCVVIIIFTIMIFPDDWSTSPILVPIDSTWPKLIGYWGYVGLGTCWLWILLACKNWGGRT